MEFSCGFVVGGKVLRVLLLGVGGILFFEDFPTGLFKLFEKLVFSQALFLNLAAKVSTETLKGLKGTLAVHVFQFLQPYCYAIQQ